jgi:hypothetical protein
MRAARAAASHALLGTPRRAAGLPERAFADMLVVFAWNTTRAACRDARRLHDSGLPRTAATGRRQPPKEAGFMRPGSRDVQWSN